MLFHFKAQRIDPGIHTQSSAEYFWVLNFGNAYFFWILVLSAVFFSGSLINAVFLKCFMLSTLFFYIQFFSPGRYFSKYSSSLISSHCSLSLDELCFKRLARFQIDLS